MKNKSRFYLNWLIIFAILLGSISIFGTVFAEDKSDILKNKEVEIVQGGKKLEEGQSIDGKSNFSFNISFDVPLIGDSPKPQKYVNYGDTARIILGKGINVATSSHPLSANGKTFGTATYTTLQDKTVVMEIIFNGDKNVFDGTGGYNGLKITANVSATVDNSNVVDDNGQKVLLILGKKYPVEITPDFTVLKSGVINETDRTIDWTIIVTGKKLEKHIDLGGYVLSDDITEAGAYKSGSFKVGNDLVSPLSSNNELKYTFKKGQNSPQTIILKTQITDEEFFRSVAVTSQIAEDKVNKKNKAKLLDNTNKELVSSTAEVEILPKKWVEKIMYQQTEKSDHHEVIWHINIYNNGVTLENVVIKDELIGVKGFEHISAKTVPMDNSGKIINNGIVFKDNITPVIKNGEKIPQYYEIGDVNTNTKLVLVTKIPKDKLEYPEGRSLYDNVSRTTWAGRSKNVSAGATVGIGAVKESKKLVNTNLSLYANRANFIDSKMDWQIDVNHKIDDYTDLKMYDIMLYDNSINEVDIGKKDINTVSLSLKENSSIIDETLFKTLLSKTHLTYQKMDPSSFKGDGLKSNIYPIYKNDKEVGHLLEVSGFSKNNRSFNISSNLVHKDLIMNTGRYGITDSKKDMAVHNDVFMSKNGRLLSTTRGYGRYMPKMTSKDVLTAQDAKNLKQNYSSEHIKTTDDNKANAFNHETNSVIYAISLNAHGHKNTKDYLGDVTVKDTLPQGWEFVDIKEGSKYIIYKGTAQSKTLFDENAKVQAVGDVITDFSQEFGDVLENITSNEMSLTFKNLNGPYVLLLEARPTKDKLKSYAKDDKKDIATETNTAKVIAKGKEINDTQDIVFAKKILKKGEEKVVDGVRRWNIDYLPNGIIDEKNVYLKDELSEGMELRTDSTGKLVFDSDNFTIYEISSVDIEDNVNLGQKLGDIENYISYDKDTRVLKLLIPNKDKSYRFSYVTDLTGNANIQVSNTVSLVGGDVQPTAKPANYTIQASDASASIQKNAFLEIIKKNEDGELLENAEFTLELENGNTMKSTSGANGIARFDRIPLTNNSGHTLKETKAPKGYIADKTEYKVIVDKLSSPMVKIEGTKESLSNKITITNTKDIPQVSTEGILKVKKIVTGNQGELDRAFNFTFNLMDLPQGSPDLSYDYKITDDSNNVISSDTISKNNKTFRLKHNQTIEIKGLPVGARYKIDEDDYINDGYEKTSLREEGTISSNMDTVVFTNKKHILPQVTTNTSLTISKEIQGNLARSEDKFQFKIYFDTDASKQYKYTIDNNVNKHSIKNEDEFELSGGQSITIEDVEIGNIFRIKEVNTLGYTPNSEEISVTTTTAPELNIVKFVNTKEKQIKYGSLKITKTIQGNLADITKKFKFIVKIGQDINKYYDYEGLGAIENGKIKSGDEIWLSNGQGIVIKDIIVGTDYEIKENNEDYVKNVSGDKGTIVLGENIANFINTKNSTGGDGPSGGNPPTPDKKEEPKKPEEPKKSEEPKKPQEPEKPKETETTVNPNEEPKKEPIPEIPTSDTKPPTGVPFIPTKITGKIPENKNPILTIVDENGVPIGKAQVNIKDGTYVFIDDDRVPEGTAKIHNDNTLEILEDEIPKSTTNKILSKRTLPKTGSQKEYYYIIGLILIGIGIFIRKRK